MRVLIFGAGGMLGHKLVQELGSRFDVSYTVRGKFDSISRFGIFDRDRTVENTDAESPESVECAIKNAAPDVVINAIGIVKQVPSAKNVITTLMINSIFPNRLAELRAKYGFRLITISTDCVFDGKRGMYSENDTPNATDLYGKSKNLGEVADAGCLTIRTSIIGRELASQHSLVEWFLSNRVKTVRGFTKAIYSGFPTIVFADIIASLIVDHSDLNGLYHIASSPINKFELLGMINEHYGARIDLVPSSEFVIDRSLDAIRFNSQTGYEPPSWDEMIKAMAADETPYDNWK